MSWLRRTPPPPFLISGRDRKRGCVAAAISAECRALKSYPVKDVAMTAAARRPEPIRLSDYRPPDWLVDRLELDFRLGEDGSEVAACLELRRNPAGAPGAPLVLDGQELELLGVKLDGEPLGANRYSVDDDHLTVHELPDACRLETRVRIHPERNTALEGLYLSGGNFCTQCEPEGFRKITYFPDRPDVMA